MILFNYIIPSCMFLFNYHILFMVLFNYIFYIFTGFIFTYVFILFFYIIIIHLLFFFPFFLSYNLISFTGSITYLNLLLRPPFHAIDVRRAGGRAGVGASDTTSHKSTMVSPPTDTPQNHPQFP